MHFTLFTQKLHLQEHYLPLKGNAWSSEIGVSLSLYDRNDNTLNIISLHPNIWHTPIPDAVSLNKHLIVDYTI